jgi:class 3 adenylate cyclase
MKRKIAALMAADIHGYSRLVAEDEEETLRRLASYRSVIDDFIAKASGRIFSTAGDAVLAEFPSSVEAVRCAIDIQESLRTRNLAYPPSRQMNFRIGITVGDVVEREGDLLGDGVNIAARLEGLAAPGGICVSRSIYEQVANKLSVQFADIGEQQVKNIPTPVHAYMVTMRELEGHTRTPHQMMPRNMASLTWAAALILASMAVLGGAGFIYLAGIRTPAPGPTIAASPSPPPAAPHVAAEASPPVQSVPQAAQPSPPVQPAPQTDQSSPPVQQLPQPVEASAPPVQDRIEAMVRDAAPRFDEAKVRALAAKQSVPLPQKIKLATPPPEVRKQLAEYLGAYGGDRRWGGGGRQVVLIVTGVDNSGVAYGIFAQGPPTPRTFNQNPAHYVSFEGTITDSGLKFEPSGGRWKYQFKLMPGGVMIGNADGPENRHPTIVIERVN